MNCSSSAEAHPNDVQPNFTFRQQLLYGSVPTMTGPRPITQIRARSGAGQYEISVYLKIGATHIPYFFADNYYHHFETLESNRPIKQTRL